MKRHPPVRTSASAPPKVSPKELLSDVRELILAARRTVAQGINSALVLLYWKIGQRVRKDILRERRAEYGEQIVHALSEQLTVEFGRGFTRTNMFNMVRFAETFPDTEIVHALSGQLSWTHLRQIIYLDEPLKRDFYAEMCRIERWNTRTLAKKIGSMLFERTALSRKPAKLGAIELKKLREEDTLTPDLVFRDPYLLDFLGLKDTYAEKDEELCPSLSASRLVYSYGTGNTFKHPRNVTRTDHDKAGWRDPVITPCAITYEVRETSTRGAGSFGHVLLGWKCHATAPALPCGGASCQLQAQQV